MAMKILKRFLLKQLSVWYDGLLLQYQSLIPNSENIYYFHLRYLNEYINGIFLFYKLWSIGCRSPLMGPLARHQRVAQKKLSHVNFYRY